mgnify:CR=1 FL=1
MQPNNKSSNKPVSSKVAAPAPKATAPKRRKAKAPRQSRAQLLAACQAMPALACADLTTFKVQQLALLLAGAKKHAANTAKPAKPAKASTSKARKVLGYTAQQIVITPAQVAAWCIAQGAPLPKVTVAGKVVNPAKYTWAAMQSGKVPAVFYYNSATNHNTQNGWHAQACALTAKSAHTGYMALVRAGVYQNIPEGTLPRYPNATTPLTTQLHSQNHGQIKVANPRASKTGTARNSTHMFNNVRPHNASPQAWLALMPVVALMPCATTLVA